MKQLFDFLPVIVFFATYYLFDIYAATAAAIGASVLQVAALLVRGKRPEVMHWVALVVIVVLGSATLFFKNELFIKWKPTAVYWLLSVAFLYTSYFTQKPLAQRMLEKGIELPRAQWDKLNWSWVGFFLMMGGLNIFVAYRYDTNTWVNFKMFGSLILTLLFGLAQGVYLMKYMPQSDGNK